MRNVKVSLLIAVALWIQGCATSGPHLELSEAPKPFKKSGAPALDTYNRHRIYINQYGVQAGRRHFDMGRLADYVHISGATDIADQIDKETEKVKSWGRAASVQQSLSGMVPGGAFLAGSIDHAEARGSRARRNIAELAESFNARLARALGLSLSADELSAVKQRPEHLDTVAVKLGDNASLDDWVLEYSLYRINRDWYLGYRTISESSIAGALERLGAPQAASFKSGEKVGKAGSMAVSAGLLGFVLGGVWLSVDSRTSTPVIVMGSGLGISLLGILINRIGGGMKAGAQSDYNSALPERLKKREGQPGPAKTGVDSLVPPLPE